jgi:ATP phosphoribosyltransferase regulatory subunit
LLDRYTGRTPVPPARAALIAAVESESAATLVEGAGPEIGLRDAGEVAARLDALAEDAAAAPIPAGEAEVLGTILSLKAPLRDAHERLRDVCVDLPGLAPAVDLFGARIEALEAAGIDTAGLAFEASYGRTTMEYYDGFVFGFLAEGQGGLPPVATGGRYDALTLILGGGRAIPAVGGVIRPEMLHRVMEAGR